MRDPTLAKYIRCPRIVWSPHTIPGHRMYLAGVGSRVSAKKNFGRICKGWVARQREKISGVFAVVGSRISAKKIPGVLARVGSRVSATPRKIQKY